jgi:hypothetical protein
MAPDPEPLEPDDRPRAFSVERVRPGAGDPRLSILAGVVALLVAIAVVKPWGGDPGATSSRPPRIAPAATPAPTVRPTNNTPEGLAGPICLGAGSWRVASLETWRTQDVRVWRAVEPIEDATTPLDPSIPSVPIVAVEIGALGWCAPAYGPDRPAGPARVTAWFNAPDGPVELALRQVRPPTGTTPIAALYLPLGTCALAVPCPSSNARSIPLAWVSGRVVFRYEDLGARRTAWFAADIMIISVPDQPASSPAR